MKNINHYPKDYEFERLSSCCGAPEHSDVEGMCVACHDWSGFELYDEDGNEVGVVDVIKPIYFNEL